MSTEAINEPTRVGTPEATPARKPLSHRVLRAAGIVGLTVAIGLAGHARGKAGQSETDAKAQNEYVILRTLNKDGTLEFRPYWLGNEKLMRESVGTPGPIIEARTEHPDAPYAIEHVTSNPIVAPATGKTNMELQVVDAQYQPVPNAQVPSEIIDCYII